MSIDMFPEGFINYMLEQEKDMASRNTHCKNCGNEIKVSIFKNEDWCSEDCRKVLKGETEKPSALTDAGITNILRQPSGVDPRGIR